jgi:tRNA(Arg) A34 adenosine deaminase TadA
MDLANMKIACDLAKKGVERGGGPFGCIIVNQTTGEIVGRGHNRVAIDQDPTAHAEMVAIRDACHQMDSFSLENCVLYTSCEPCPMCLSAIYWARIPRLFFGNTKEDAAAIGFDDEFIYMELQKPANERAVEMRPLSREYAQGAFLDWIDKEDRTHY